MSSSDAQPADILNGYAEIGKHLRMAERQAKHLAAIRAIPTFKLPGSSIVRARRSTLNAWLAECEQNTLEARHGERR